MKRCPHCQRPDNQVKNGKTGSGSQLYKCNYCRQKYTPEPKMHGFSKDRRQQAIRLVLDGNSQRQADRHVGFSHGTVANWFKKYADKLPGTGVMVETAEQDKLFTFIGKKKNKQTS